MDANAKKDFGYRLKFIISRKFINQKKFCEKFNFKQNTLSNYITGRTEPDLDTLIQLAEYIGESTDWLLTGKETPINLSNHFDLDIWDEVVSQCLNFANMYNFIPTGRFFVGIYQAFFEERVKYPDIKISDIINKNKSLILSQKR